VVNAPRTEIAFTLATTALGVTAARVHAGEPGRNGPPIFTLSGGSGTLAAADFVPGGGIDSFPRAVDAILRGDAYANVHTAVFPDGEIRGQIGAVTVAAAKLSGAQMVPGPVAATSSGSLTLVLDRDQARIAFTLAVAGLSSAVTEIHLHVGRVRVAGPAVLTLAVGPVSPTTSGILTPADFTPRGGLATFEDVVNAMLSGLMYVDVHTIGFEGGEIRGQIGPARMAGELDGLQMVPSVSTPGSGTCSVVLNGRQTSAETSLSFEALASAPTSAHLHLGAPGLNGQILFTLAEGAFTGPVNLILAESDLQPATGIAAFPDAADSMLGGLIYADVHTVSHPNGEIRGQIEPRGFPGPTKPSSSAGR
jgi:hypothetical protein